MNYRKNCQFHKSLKQKISFLSIVYFYNFKKERSLAMSFSNMDAFVFSVKDQVPSPPVLAPKPQFYFGQIPSDAESRKSMERVTAIEKVKRNEALTHPNRQQAASDNQNKQLQQTGKQKDDSSSQAAVGAVKSRDSVDSKSKPAVVDSVSTTRAAAKLQELFEVPQAPKLNSVTKSR